MCLQVEVLITERVLVEEGIRCSTRFCKHVSDVNKDGGSEELLGFQAEKIVVGAEGSGGSAGSSCWCCRSEHQVCLVPLPVMKTDPGPRTNRTAVCRKSCDQSEVTAGQVKCKPVGSLEGPGPEPDLQSEDPDGLMQDRMWPPGGAPAPHLQSSSGSCDVMKVQVHEVIRDLEENGSGPGSAPPESSLGVRVLPVFGRLEGSGLQWRKSAGPVQNLQENFQ